MAVINGNAENVEGITLDEYLKISGYEKNQVVVERNLEIISRDRLDKIKIEADDVIEILNFVGGGEK